MIELKNLSFSYENANTERGQLQDICLSVKQGELVLLAGKSGCGKTTLTRVLNGLCPQFYPGNLTGEYCLDGENALEMSVHRLGAMVGSVFQDPRSQFFATNTTDEMVLGMENVPLERPVMEERLHEVCRQMDMERLLDRRIYPLSSGEKQMVAIASVCATKPKVLVLDEPSANLDSEAVVRLGSLLYRLKMAGHTIVLSEHRFHYVQECFDRMVFMENGVISEIYSREDALSLSEGRLAAMGLRPFAVPALRVGGAFVSGQEDMLQVSSISWTMDHRQILDRISFSAVRGKILAIAGPNGAGKSSLCRVITGLHRASGTVCLDGEYLKRKRRTRQSFFVQQDAVYQLYAPTVLGEFSLGKKETPEMKTAALARLSEMGLEDLAARHPASLSGGQKQRLLLALAAESGRRLMVFDEPTSGLDGYHMRLTVKVLKDLAKAGHCVVLITHDMDLISAAADGVLYIVNGEVRYHRNTLRDKVNKTYYQCIANNVCNTSNRNKD
ncbi:ABC transporter ATP-binding protein [Clostridiales bacterium NSJ-32]|uniref:ABC transporter ATP-binding protein n=1 Tax=Bianquea renquensis TaxID=2763661 RepID=A0A926DWK0_9FIRM|nr:ABC transporter ATP-binding protein [Bianquea renquensis]